MFAPSRPVFGVFVPQVAGFSAGLALALVAGPSWVVNVESHEVLPAKQFVDSLPEISRLPKSAFVGLPSVPLPENSLLTRALPSAS